MESKEECSWKFNSCSQIVQMGSDLVVGREPVGRWEKYQRWPSPLFGKFSQRNRIHLAGWEVYSIRVTLWWRHGLRWYRTSLRLHLSEGQVSQKDTSIRRFLLKAGRCNFGVCCAHHAYTRVLYTCVYNPLGLTRDTPCSPLIRLWRPTSSK